jgi:predicted MPP superfamily phosphohydrolase
MIFAWLTDIHLEFLTDQEVQLFFQKIVDAKTSGIFLTGDISITKNICHHLTLMSKILSVPIYFVLGNHDYYGGNISETRHMVETISNDSNNLCYLPTAGIVELTDSVCLIGHGSWADGRFGASQNSNVTLNDYFKIEDFIGKGKVERFALLNQLGDQAAIYLEKSLQRAIELYDNIYLLTHVPPFAEACWHNGEIADGDYLPHFACKAVGDILIKIMSSHPEKQLIVLCGHTHSDGIAQILPNLLVKTGKAQYGKPEIQKIIHMTK